MFPEINAENNLRELKNEALPMQMISLWGGTGYFACVMEMG